MKRISKLPSIVYKFYDEILVQLGEHIKVVQPNNASEYAQSIMNSFFINHGLIHQASCAHTSQQNGVVKWKPHQWLVVHLIIRYVGPNTFFS